MAGKLRNTTSVTLVALVLSLMTAGAAIGVTGYQHTSGHAIVADDKGPTASVVPTVVQTVAP
ncbi:hypothetical protein [Actinospica robiniae]|uniref:hypothetical protein n=1 Tax=Actinospica robiniae TaxID=304901 RepID=UPI0004241EF1|nr:hypothetical protein [Actinospica robiniae]